MAIPPNAKKIPQPMDPSDVLPWAVDLTQGEPTGSSAPFLLPGESVASFTLAVTAEAIAAGLSILADATYPPPTIDGLELTFWPTIAPEARGLSIFDGGGRDLALELTATTNSMPPKTKQRTIVITVAQQ